MASPSLPTLRILATGGTIAGAAGNPQERVQYQAAMLRIDDLIAVVPALQALPAQRQASQILQKDSKDLEVADWLVLAHAVDQALADPQVAGVVVTHGTDTLEETAWFLHRVLPASPKPVVLVSAMRPATALDADGPQNLLDACQVALSGQLSGVVAVAAGEVHDGRQVQKVQPFRIPAFSSGNAAPLGWIEDGSVRLNSAHGPADAEASATHDEPLQALLAPGRYTALLRVAPGALPAPPVVAWITSHAGFDARQVSALAAAGFDGLLVAGTGNGTLHHALAEALRTAAQAGVRVALASRCAFGPMVGVVSTPDWRALPLPAAKARVEWLLELWLARVSQ